MIKFRQAEPEEIDDLLKEGYQVWSKNRTYQQYSEDNRKEDAYGTRYVIEDNGEIVSSLILLRFDMILGQKVYGIGSVLTPPKHKHKGYASELLRNCMEQIVETESMVFLYSEVAPAFYERFRFRSLPKSLQREDDSICMVMCEDMIWAELLELTLDSIPEHF